ncbi:hypothetical protein [Acinetobacter variabilis]|uniref:hypothetical protein n=1 Tax=Acinetobacter variabilis TaxID=70346 RepID=UPI002673DFE1|nr:hypothetical protein [Acinetobacter variabilis]
MRKQPTPAVGFLFPKLAYNSKSNNNKTITMKHITFITLLLSLAFTGYQKQQAADVDLDAVTTALEKSDNILGVYIEKLNSEFTTQDVRIKIICRDYPREYQKNYMTNLLKLSPGEYSEATLLADMDVVLDHYKEIDAIQC